MDLLIEQRYLALVELGLFARLRHRSRKLQSEMVKLKDLSGDMLTSINQLKSQGHWLLNYSQYSGNMQNDF